MEFSALLFFAFLLAFLVGFLVGFLLVFLFDSIALAKGLQISAMLAPRVQRVPLLSLRNSVFLLLKRNYSVQNGNSDNNFAKNSDVIKNNVEADAQSKANNEIDAQSKNSNETVVKDSQPGLTHQHIQNQHNIQKTIEALQHRINTNPEKLEKTLELLHNPQTAPRPHLMHFKFPLINFVLLASTIYYLLNYIREYLDYQETQKDYSAQVEQLHSEFLSLESELAQKRKQKQSSSPSSLFSIWSYFRFF